MAEVPATRRGLLGAAAPGGGLRGAVGARLSALLGARASAARRVFAGAPAPSAGRDEVLAAHCLQCGRDRTDVVRRARGRLRVSCRACGAITVQDASRLRAPAREQAVDGAAVAAGPHPLAPYVSSELLAWARATGRDRRAAKLDKPTIYRLWKEFDRHNRDLAAAGGEDPGLGDRAVPSFGEVTGALQARCYDERAVVRDLLGADPDPGFAAAIAERATCSRRWLAGPGREHCWIDRRCGDEPVDVDLEVVRALLEDGALGDGALDGPRRAALYGAAFGTAGGPPTREIVRRFDAATIAAALETHLRDGSHPLRDPVLAALDGCAPDRLGSGMTTEVRVPC